MGFVYRHPSVSCGCILNDFFSFRSECWTMCNVVDLRRTIYEMVSGKSLINSSANHLESKNIYKVRFLKQSTSVPSHTQNSFWSSVSKLLNNGSWQVWLKLVFFNSFFFSSSVLFLPALSHLTLQVHKEYLPNWTSEPRTVLKWNTGSVKKFFRACYSQNHTSL